MEKIKVRLFKAMPWLLVVFGFLLLDKFSPFICGGCVLLGLVMLIELRWPEKWGQDNDVIAN